VSETPVPTLPRLSGKRHAPEGFRDKIIKLSFLRFLQSHLPPRIPIPIIECFPILSWITSSDIARNGFGVGYQFRRNGHNHSLLHNDWGQPFPNQTILLALRN
jgi:hypothetical protein